MRSIASRSTIKTKHAKRATSASGQSAMRALRDDVMLGERSESKGSGRRPLSCWPFETLAALVPQGDGSSSGTCHAEERAQHASRSTEHAPFETLAALVPQGDRPPAKRALRDTRYARSSG